MTKLKTNLFKEEKYNALYQALEECMKNWFGTLYVYLEKVDKKSFVIRLVDKLDELGYKITKK